MLWLLACGCLALQVRHWRLRAYHSARTPSSFCLSAQMLQDTSDAREHEHLQYQQLQGEGYYGGGGEG